MSTFEERQKGYEKKFALDEELKFKSEARRNKLLAEWAAAKLGLSGDAVEDYVKAVRKADLSRKGDGDVIEKVKADFDAKGVAVSAAEIQEQLGKFLADAVQQIESERK